MGLKYTGRADELSVHGKLYTTPERYRRNPDKKDYAGSFDKPIPISKRDAAHLMENSSLHSFEDDGGNDLLEVLTAPTPTIPSASAVVPKDKDK